MDGTTWMDRQPTDWLASNGRWYPASAYPRGWKGTALPPAPGHGGAASTMAKYAKKAGIDGNGPVIASFVTSDGNDGHATSNGAPRQSPRRPEPRVKTPPPPSASGSSGFTVAKSGRSVADATVTNQRNYAEKLPTGAPQPPPLGSGTSASSPGRVRDLPAPTPSAPDAVSSPPAPTSPPVPYGQASSSGAAQNFEVVAGDLGKVLGSAKQKIQEALNESMDGGAR